MGVPAISAVVYNTSATDLPFTISAALRQPRAYQNTPRVQNTFHDLTTRALVQLDYNVFARGGDTHDVRVGIGSERLINDVDLGYPGNGYVLINWDRSFQSPVTGQTQRGAYGYYEVNDFGIRGSAGGNTMSLYVQDKWTVIPRLTISLGLRTENESVPSFRRDLKDPAIGFGFGDKLAPRIGGSVDLLGNGYLKIFGSWSRFFDQVKYNLSRAAFGGRFWTVRYRGLDTLDVFSLSGTTTPGKNLWTDDPNSVRNLQLPSLDNIDPHLKPMSADLLTVGAEYQMHSGAVIAGRYVHNGLRRTIEDMGALIGGNQRYLIGNPGEGRAMVMPTSGATRPFPTPQPRRTYNALVISWTRRFSQGWFGPQAMCIVGSTVITRAWQIRMRS